MFHWVFLKGIEVFEKLEIKRCFKPLKVEAIVEHTKVLAWSLLKQKKTGFSFSVAQWIDQPLACLGIILLCWSSVTNLSGVCTVELWSLLVVLLELFNEATSLKWEVGSMFRTSQCVPGGANIGQATVYIMHWNCNEKLYLYIYIALNSFYNFNYLTRHFQILNFNRPNRSCVNSFILVLVSYCTRKYFGRTVCVYVNRF